MRLACGTCLENKHCNLVRPGAELFGHAISSQNAQVMDSGQFSAVLPLP